MEPDLVLEVTKIEKEAEGIIKEARESARGLEAQAEEEIARLRQTLEKEFKERAEVLRLRLESERKGEEKGLKEGFERAQNQIRRLEGERSEKVLDYLVKRICGS